MLVKLNKVATATWVKLQGMFQVGNCDAGKFYFNHDQCFSTKFFKAVFTR